MTSMRLHRARTHHPRHDQHLLHHRLFASCSDGELGVVARNTTKHEMPAGAVLMRQGHVGRELVVVLSGTATVLVDGAEVGSVGPGDFVGEIALLDRRARTATVVADTDLVVLVCGIPEFTELLVGAPHVSRAMLRGMAERLRRADRRVLAA